MHTIHRLAQVWGANAVVLVGPIKYQTKLINVLNIIGLFFYLLFLLSNTITRREYTGGDSAPDLNKVLKFKIKLNYKMFLFQEQYTTT